MINRLPQPKSVFISPYEKLWNVKVIVSDFCVSGCGGYVFMPSCLQTNLTRRQYVVSLLDMTTRENDGGIAISQVDNVTHHEIWCLMKYLRCGL